MKLNPFVVASLSLVFAIAACGSDSNGGTGPGAGGTDSSGKGGTDSSGKGGSDSGKGGSSSSGKGGTSSGSFTGCINGNGFSCKSSAALDACFDEGQCDECSPDDTACEGSGKGGSSSGKGGSDSGKGGSSTGKGGSDSGKKETGTQCVENAECVGEACLKAGDADFGYCTNVCESFSDCPSFWDCEKVGNATSKYCVQGE